MNGGAHHGPAHPNGLQKRVKVLRFLGLGFRV